MKFSKTTLIFLSTILIITLVFIYFVVFPYPKATYPLSQNAELHLTSYQFEEHGIVPLDGEWAFYWKELYTPYEASFKTNNQYVDTPQSWAKITSQNIDSPYGYATYYLTVYTNSSETLGILIPYISTSYKLWINDELKVVHGMVGQNKQRTLPRYGVETVYFKPENGKFTLTIQVANYIQRTGGIKKSLYLGLDKQINQQRYLSIAWDMIISGALLATGLYHLAHVIFYRREYGFLYLGVFSTLLGVRKAFLDSIMIAELFPYVDGTVLLKIEYVLTYVAVAVCIKFVVHLFPGPLPSKWATVIGIVLTSFSLLAPTEVLSNTIPTFHAFIILASFYALYLLVMAVLRKQQGALLALLGFGFFGYTFIHDILFFNEIIRTTTQSAFGWFIFILCYACILAIQYADSVQETESLARQLQYLNQHLEDKILERTHELEQKTKEVIRLEKSRRHLLSNISHDLLTPLTTLRITLQGMIDGVIHTKEKQQAYLQASMSKLLHLQALIEELFELSKLEARKIPFEYVHYHPENFFKEMIQMFKHDIEQHKMELRYYINTSSQEEPAYIYLDSRRMIQVFANVTANAIKFSSPPAEIIYTLTFHDQHIVFSIEDSGIGIEKNDLPFVFERFYTKDKTRQGSGLGLAISKEIVEQHNGRIWVQNNQNGGSSFFILLPLTKHH
ncbi:sensor histidine kinase [Bacillus tianshenii]|nr:sensor histidine kinase [Bacillus tianshenii]